MSLSPEGFQSSQENDSESKKSHFFEMFERQEMIFDALRKDPSILEDIALKDPEKFRKKAGVSLNEHGHFDQDDLEKIMNPPGFIGFFSALFENVELGTMEKMMNALDREEVFLTDRVYSPQVGMANDEITLWTDNPTTSVDSQDMESKFVMRSTSDISKGRVGRLKEFIQGLTEKEGALFILEKPEQKILPNRNMVTLRRRKS